MVIEENAAESRLTPDEAAFVRLIDRALIEGAIREDRLLPLLARLNLGPEIVKKLYEQLEAHHIRLIQDVEDPSYTPETRSLICQLLDERENLLTDRERQVLTLRLKEHQSLETVAAQMGVTRTRILQVERKAIRILSRRRNTERRKKIREFCEEPLAENEESIYSLPEQR